MRSLVCVPRGSFRIAAFILLLLPANRFADAGDSKVRDLSTDEQQALTRITEARVLSTISFLASDEMAGRDTPSKELNIAGSYVAARFRGAGLEGLGPEGSFFQTSRFSVTQPPSEEAEVTFEDGGVRRFRVFAGLPEELEVNGKILSESEALAATDPSIVLMDEPTLRPQAVGRPAMVVAVVARQVRRLAARGVKVVLIKCGAESVLGEAALSLRDKPVPNRDGLQPECCVVLVPADLDVAGASLTIRAGAQRSFDAPVRNVLGVLPGADQQLAQEAVLISAHLDHIGTVEFGPDRINNGADDNATGVTAVLSLADAFGSLKQRPQRSVIFAAFWGEEKGLLGSKQFAAEPLWPLAAITANINIEMIGRPEVGAQQKAWMTGWKHSNLGDVMNAGAQRVGIEIFDRKDVGEMLYSRSDNYSLVQKGVIAHSFSAGSLHADYHQPGDEWEKLDLPHMTRVIQGLFAGALVVANGDLSLSPVEE